MPTIKLTDNLGADLGVQLAEGSDLLRYLQPLPALIANGADLSHADGLTLAEPAVRSFSTGLGFQNPSSIGDGSVELAVKAGVSGNFAVHSREPGAENLFDSMGEEIEIPTGTCYAATGIVAQASVGGTAPVGAFQFGAEPGASLEITNYHPWPANTTLLEALTGGLQTFVFPTSLAALEGITSRGVLTVSTKGKLRVSASAELLTAVNPLASLNLPASALTPQIKTGGSVQVEASYEIVGEYQIRAHRLPNAHVRLGWYRRGSGEFQVKATASAGVSTGDTDIFATLLRVISGNPKVNRDELLAAGLSDAQIHDLREAVKVSISRKLELSVGAQVNQVAAGEAAFLYDVDPVALTPESRAAIDQALRCDLGALHGKALPGITCVRTIVSTEKSTTSRLPINLLGIYGFTIVEKLASGSSMMVEPETGTLVLTDENSAKRMRLLTMNFGADLQKLRLLLAESFLLTAVYRGSEHAINAPELSCSHSYFRLDNDTNSDEMAKNLRVGVALGLLTGAAAQLPVGVVKFDRTLLHAETSYKDATSLSLFVDGNGDPWPRKFYESGGRKAIEQLVAATDEDAVRRRPATDDTLWEGMKDLGPATNFKALLPGVPDPLRAAITADYLTIAWWADCMSDAAGFLAQIRKLTTKGTSKDDPQFIELRKNLAKQLTEATARTREEFGQPWGLLAMFEASRRRAQASFVITGPHLVRDAEQPLVRTA